MITSKQLQKNLLTVLESIKIQAGGNWIIANAADDAKKMVNQLVKELKK